MVVPLPPTLIPLHPGLAEPPPESVKEALIYRTVLQVLLWIQGVVVIMLLISPAPHLAFSYSISIFLGCMACRSTMPFRYRIYALVTVFVCLSSTIRFMDRITLPEFGHSYTYRVLRLAHIISSILESQADAEGNVPYLVIRQGGAKPLQVGSAGMQNTTTLLDSAELLRLVEAIQKENKERTPLDQAFIQFDKHDDFPAIAGSNSKLEGRRSSSASEEEEGGGPSFISLLSDRRLEQQQGEKSTATTLSSYVPPTFSSFLHKRMLMSSHVQDDYQQPYSFLSEKDPTILGGGGPIPYKRRGGGNDDNGIAGSESEDLPTATSFIQQRPIIELEKQHLEEFVNFRPAQWRSTLEMIAVGLGCIVTAAGSVVSMICGQKIEHQVNLSIARALGAGPEDEEGDMLLPAPTTVPIVGEEPLAARVPIIPTQPAAPVEPLPGPYETDPMGERTTTFRPFAGRETTLEEWLAQDEQERAGTTGNQQNQSRSGNKKEDEIP